MAPSSVLEAAGRMVRSMNPRLLPVPPPYVESTTQGGGGGGRGDVCYLGTIPGYNDILCDRDLPPGMRSVVGSWYLTPERHIVEYVMVTWLAVFTISMILQRLPPPSRSSVVKGRRRNPPIPLPVRVVSVAFCLTQFLYKRSGYAGKVLSMLLPCNILWIMHLILALPSAVSPLRNSAKSFDLTIQLLVSYSGLALVALAVPDTDDLVLPGERTFFYVHHVALILLPTYYVGIGGQASLLPPPASSSSSPSLHHHGHHMKMTTLASAFFALTYFTVITPVCIFSGINLNYMLSPPPNPGNVVSGPNFRVMSTLCCATLFAVSRYGALALEIWTKRMMADRLQRKREWGGLGEGGEISKKKI